MILFTQYKSWHFANPKELEVFMLNVPFIPKMLRGPRMILGTALLSVLTLANFASAQTVEAPVAPEGHATYALTDAATADRAAYDEAIEKHGECAEATERFNTAFTTLETAFADGTATAEMLTERQDAQSAMGEACGAFSAAMRDFTSKRAAFESALSAADAVSPLINRVTALEDLVDRVTDLEEVAPVITTEALTELLNRVTNLETANTLLKDAVCEGHNYDHEHAAAYHSVCPHDHAEQTDGS